MTTPDTTTTQTNPAAGIVAAIAQGNTATVEFDAAIVRRVSLLARSAEGWPAVTSREEHTAAAARFTEIREIKKRIEEARVQITRPLLEAQRLVKARADEITGALSRGERMLADKIALFEEAERKREAAEAEVRRAAAEQARREAAEAERARAEAEAAAKAAGEPAQTYDLTAVEPTPPRVVEAPQVVAPPLKSVTSTRKVQTLKIVDVTLIPVELGGVRLLVPDEAKILGLLKAGMTVPGCELETATSTVARGGGR